MSRRNLTRTTRRSTISLLENLETRTLLSSEPVMATVVGTTFPGATVAEAPLSGTFSLLLQSLGSTPEPKGGQVQVVLQAENLGTGIYTELVPPKLVKLPALAVGGTTKLSMTVKLPEGLAAGDYDYFAQILPAPGVVTNPIDTVGGPNTMPRTLALHVSDPVYAVGGTMVSSTLQSSNTGVSGKVALTIENEGNVAWARGQQLQVQIVAAGAVTDAGDPGSYVLGTETVKAKKGGLGGLTKVTVPVKYTQALGGADYTIEAEVTALAPLPTGAFGNAVISQTAADGTLTLHSTNAAHLTPLPPASLVDESRATLQDGNVESGAVLSGNATIDLGDLLNLNVGNQTINLGDAGGSGTLILSGSNTYSGPGEITASNLTWSGEASAGNLTLGNVTLTLANGSATGGTTIPVDNGTLTVKVGNLTLQPSVPIESSGVLTINVPTQTSPVLTLGNGTVDPSLSGTYTLVTDGNTITLTIVTAPTVDGGAGGG